MFSEVPIAVERLALCLHTHRRIGAAHALRHLRNLVTACRALRRDIDREIVSALERSLYRIDAAVALDRLDESSLAAAERELSAARFRIWQLENWLLS